MNTNITIKCKHCDNTVGSWKVPLIFETQALADARAGELGWSRSQDGDGWVCPDCTTTKQDRGEGVPTTHIQARLAHLTGKVGALTLNADGTWLLFPGEFDFTKGDPSYVRVHIEKDGKIVTTGTAWIKSNGTYTFRDDRDLLKLVEDSSSVYWLEK